MTYQIKYNSSNNENNFFLGRWYRRQEIEYNRGKLQDKKTDELLKFNIDLKSKFKKNDSK